LAQDWAEITILKMSLSEQVVNIWTPIGSRLGRDYNTENVPK